MLAINEANGSLRTRQGGRRVTMPPEAFGDWNSVFRRFSRWRLKGVWRRIFEAMSEDPDFEYLIVDSTIVRVVSEQFLRRRSCRSFSL